MRPKVIVIGAGINGLVAANYLCRAGCEVTLLEKKDKVGGACTFERLTFENQVYSIPSGASVFGMMQDFVFRETGLDKRVTFYRPQHPGMVYFGDEPDPMLLFDDPVAYQAEARMRWGEKGNIVGYSEELEQVRQFLIGIYRQGTTPTYDLADRELGTECVNRWIRGSASALFEHYFTSDRTKIFKSMPVTESGPVPLNGPSTAFNIAAMSSGSVDKGGNWGFIKGGLWHVPLELASLNQELGVKILTNVQVEGAADHQVSYTHDGFPCRESADAIFFATDPLTATRLTGDAALLQSVSTRRMRGSSGKVVLVFREPVVWKHNGNTGDSDASFRFLYDIDNLGAFEASGRAVREKGADFSPCAFQIYPEGAAMRRVGWNEPYDYLSIFSKDFGLSLSGRELPHVKAYIEQRILSRLVNPQALVGSVLYTPRDLQESFYFPEGNIDHMELCEGQNYFARTFSSDPTSEFYRFGAHPGLYYCGAGSFPCGSVAGTPGYLAATQWLSRRA